MAVLEAGPVDATRSPDPEELERLGRLGLDLGQAQRISGMNSIGSRLQVPAGGWPHSQAKLFDRGDIRLVPLLRLLSRTDAARAIALNLARAAQFSETNIMLTLVTASRESGSAITASTDRMLDSWQNGGLDFLWKTKDQLGLPRSITEHWEPGAEFRSLESKRRAKVSPAYIPARDQTMVYAAQISSSFQRHFKRRLARDLGDVASVALARASRVARLVWQAFSFLAPGGSDFDPGRRVQTQISQGFGSISALGYVEHSSRAANPEAVVDLDRILTDPALNASAWVRSAKVRVCETLFLERLLTTARELRW
jgi:hypothetical protein